MIESYKFGEIIINGKKYNSDLIILKDRIYDNWWRKEGHNLCIDDLKKIIDKKPDILIIGTGSFGLMKVSLELINYLETNNIEVIIKKTKEACDEYNKLYQKENVVAAFHLTC